MSYCEEHETETICLCDLEDERESHAKTKAELSKLKEANLLLIEEAKDHKRMIRDMGKRAVKIEGENLGLTRGVDEAKEELDAAEAKKRLGGGSEAGGSDEKPKEETNKEYRIRIEKDLATGKTEFGN